MKNITFFAVCLALTGLVSCGGSVDNALVTEYCNCKDVELSILKETQNTNGQAEYRAVTEKYQAQTDACKEFYNDLATKSAAMTPEEQQDLQSSLSDCPAIAEMEEIMTAGR